MYIHEICEWLAEVKMQERKPNMNTFDEASSGLDEGRNESEQAMLNGLSLRQRNGLT